MKRVLIFSLAYYPSHVSGAEIAIKEITDRLGGKMAFILITHRFTPSAPPIERIGQVLVYRVGWGPSYLSKILFVPFAAHMALQIHKKERFDALWAVMTYMLFPLVLARMFGVRVPYILTLQDGDPYEKVFERWFIRPLAPVLDFGMRHATVVQTISNHLAQWPRMRGYKGVVEVIPNGASDESSRIYSPKEIAALKTQLGKKEGDVYLLSIGRLVHQKAIDDVIRALALLPQQVHLIIVGMGPNKEALEQLARERGVEHRVRFVGRLERDETAKYRSVCDIFVLPSRSEGQGISLVSSMAAGLPIIATQEGGIVDFLFDAKRNPEKPTTGWAVDVNSPEQIAAAVEDILAHPEQVRTVIENARTLAREKYNWDNIAKDIQAKIFDKVLSATVA